VADAPWRCSQCGTVNEPVANACRTCGRWPSLFDLEQSTIEAGAPDVEEDIYEARTVDVEERDPEDFDVGGEEVETPTELEADDEEAGPAKSAWQRFARLIVPIGVVLYILISSLANR
jgi:predicted  nucleic acid-binding Zn-ribbon protein